MIQRQGRFFSIATQGTSYCFYVTEQGFPQHLYYGRRIDVSPGWQALAPQVRHFPGNAAVLDGICLEDTALEVSFPGLGDLREPFAAVETADGSPADLRFVQAAVLPEKPGRHLTKAGTVWARMFLTVRYQ